MNKTTSPASEKSLAGVLFLSIPFYFTAISNIIKISGMVMHERKCETSAIPAATEVSFPYALGTTIVLSPNGIARQHTVQSAKEYSTFTNIKNTIAISGIKIKRIIDIT